MAYIQTIWPWVDKIDFFTQENVDYLSKKITQVINKDITTPVKVDEGSIIRVMQRVLEQRLETIPRMNQRVIMYVVNDYLNYQVECNRNLKWADGFVQSQRLYDPTVRRGVIANWTPKINPKNVPTTSRFYFT